MWGPNGHWEESELQWEAMMILKTGVMCSDLDAHTLIWLQLLRGKKAFGDQNRGRMTS